MVDVVARLSGPVAVGSDSEASISFGGGGSAANAAAWLAFAGAAPALVARVGDDARGAEAAGELRAAGVDARLALDGEHPTGTCVVLVAPGGERSMLPDPGANAALAPADLPEDAARRGRTPARGRVLAGARPGRGRRRSRRSSGPARGHDGVGRSLVGGAAGAGISWQLAEGVALLLPNVDEAAALTGLRGPRPRRPPARGALPGGGRQARGGGGALDGRQRRGAGSGRWRLSAAEAGRHHRGRRRVRRRSPGGAPARRPASGGARGGLRARGPGRRHAGRPPARAEPDPGAGPRPAADSRRRRRSAAPPARRAARSAPSGSASASTRIRMPAKPTSRSPASSKASSKEPPSRRRRRSLAGRQEAHRHDRVVGAQPQVAQLARAGR